MHDKQQNFPSYHSSFIQPHASYTLLQQQAMQMSHTIQIKQKKIIYLESQLKTIKQEYANRLELIQNAYSQLKRQNSLQEKQYLQQKHVDCLEWQEKIKKINDDNRESFLDKDKVYQKMFNDTQQRFQTTLKNVQTRYQSIVNKLKEENTSLQNILLLRGNHSDSHVQDHTQQVGKHFTFGTDQYKYISASPNMSNPTFKDIHNPSHDSTLMKDKTSLLQELFALKQKHQKLNKQLDTQKKINLQMQNDHRIHKMQLEQEISTLLKQSENLNNKIHNLLQERQTDKKVYTQRIFDLQRRNQRIHSHMKEIDQTYLLALTNRTRQQKPSPVTAIKSCNHTGLIAQFQRNIEIKDQQIHRLSEKVNHLENMLGLNKNIAQRLSQIGNVSQRALQLHKTQKEKIFNKTTKLSKR